MHGVFYFFSYEKNILNYPAFIFGSSYFMLIVIFADARNSAYRYI